MSQHAATISLVVAVAENGVIGRDGGLPWRLSSDLKSFRATTMGKPLIMGRKTFQSLKSPLDGRDNIVVSRGDALAGTDGIFVAQNLEEALALGKSCAAARGAHEIMVIGGSEIFLAALPLATRMYWTHVEGAPEGDTHFPAFDAHEWHVVSRHPIPRGSKDEFSSTLKILHRIGPPKDGTICGAVPPPSPPPS